MPTPTRIMLESSKIIKTYGWLVLAALAIGFVSFRGYIATGAGRLWWDGFR
jgi:type II secretory pathway component PulF